MISDNFCFYLQNRLIQTSQTGGQRYSDIFPFSIPWLRVEKILKLVFSIFRNELQPRRRRRSVAGGERQGSPDSLQ